MENDWYHSVLEEGIEQGILDGYYRGLGAGYRQGQQQALRCLVQRKLGDPTRLPLEALGELQLTELLVAVGLAATPEAVQCALDAAFGRLETAA